MDIKVLTYLKQHLSKMMSHHMKASEKQRTRGAREEIIIFLVLDINLRSHMSASSRPPATQKPSMAAITGLLNAILVGPLKSVFKLVKSCRYNVNGNALQIAYHRS